MPTQWALYLNFRTTLLMGALYLQPLDDQMAALGCFYGRLWGTPLSLNPSPRMGEGLQPGPPSPILGEGAGG
ncbi:MAG: hypothetical protein F6K30_16475 [Cyanothece sp. SIO2G6]|nr:hypothetical protein [Cyanothece sp. SIO2G6]